MSPLDIRPTVRGAHGVAACGHPLAASAALRVFDAGGGAVDAAIGAAAALGVVLPDACGVGGDTMALVRDITGRIRAYNGSGAAPYGLRIPVQGEAGRSVAVPGAVAAWGDLHRDYGRLGLEEVLAPAIALAENGFPLSDGLAVLLRAHRHRLSRWAPDWQVSTSSVAGNLVRQPALARTLGRIAIEGARTLYDGDLAEATATAVQRGGGQMTRRDLHDHYTVVREPVTTQIGRARIAVQPPVSQAILATMVLRSLQGLDVDGSARTHAAVELIESAFEKRSEIADAGAVTKLIGHRLEFDPLRASRRGGPRGYSHTAAVTTADEGGTVVSMLVSVFDDFGSALLVPQGGFLLNNRLEGFRGEPGETNGPRGGRRPVHTLSPVIVEQDGRVFALATPGADAQVQTLVQLLDAIVAYDLPIPEALALPRWASVDSTLMLEATFSGELAATLRTVGHEIRREPAGSSVFGAACIAGRDKVRETLFAVTDPRRETWAASL